MAPSPDEKSLPSSDPPSSSSASTRNTIGARLNRSRESLRTSCRQWAWPAYRQRLQRSNLPILVGPYLGEVGLETLYWQPFVEQVRQTLGIDPARLIPVTRSGAHVWYGYPKALEVYGMREVADVRIENRLRVMRTGVLKQTSVTPFDRAIYRDAAETLGLKDYLTLHPAWMYQTLQPFFHGERGVGWAERRLRFGPLPRPVVEMTLPPRYVAVSYYARATWPPNQITAQISRESIALIAKQLPVVLLHQGLFLDDHVDFVPKPLPPNVHLLSDLVTATPQTSLLTLSAVIAGAAAFVGTYGGLSHLALRYGIPSVNLYTDWTGVLLAHRHLSEAFALQAKLPYHVLKVSELPIVQDVLPRVILQAVASSSQKTVAPQPAIV
jgi:hypothetical protein